MENWIASFMNHTQGWFTVRECCRHALEKGCLLKALGIGKHVAVQSPGGLSQDEAMRMVQATQYYPR